MSTSYLTSTLTLSQWEDRIGHPVIDNVERLCLLRAVEKALAQERDTHIGPRLRAAYADRGREPRRVFDRGNEAFMLTERHRKGRLSLVLNRPSFQRDYPELVPPAHVLNPFLQYKNGLVIPPPQPVRDNYDGIQPGELMAVSLEQRDRLRAARDENKAINEKLNGWFQPLIDSGEWTGEAIRFADGRVFGLKRRVFSSSQAIALLVEKEPDPAINRRYWDERQSPDSSYITVVPVPVSETHMQNGQEVDEYGDSVW